MTADPIVLLVDDNPNDALLMDTVFQRSGYERPLRFVSNGDDAIAYLRGDGNYGDRTQYPLPAIVLLDLNMPRTSGFDVLAWLRRQPMLARIHVCILSSSPLREDVDKAYDLGANAYLTKPSSLGDLLYLAKALVTWLKLCQFATVADSLNDPKTAGTAPQAVLAGQHWR